MVILSHNALHLNKEWRWSLAIGRGCLKDRWLSPTPQSLLHALTDEQESEKKVLARDNLNSEPAGSKYSMELEQTDSGITIIRSPRATRVGLLKPSPLPKVNGPEFDATLDELSEASLDPQYAICESSQEEDAQRLSELPDPRVSARTVHWLRTQGDLSRSLARQVECIDGLPGDLKKLIVEAHANVAGILESGACDLEWLESGQ